MKQFIFALICLPILAFSQKSIGIGTENPTSRLHLHQGNGGTDPVSAIQLTSNASGSSSSDGVKMEINGLSASILNKEAGLLTLGSGNLSSLFILTDGKIGFNTNQMVGASDFTLRSRNSYWGGMYIDSPNTNNDGRPFYGYSLNNNISLFHYYDAADDRFKFHFGGNSESTFSFKSDGQFLLNTNSAFSSDIDLILRSRGVGSTGGMFIDTPNFTTAPLYGYAINSVQKAVHYYNVSLGSWVLRVGSNNGIVVQDDGNVGLGENDPDEKLVVDGKLRLTLKSRNDSQNGSIVFNGLNFWARINDNWYRMTNATTSTPNSHPDNEEVVKIKEENEVLKMQLTALAKRLDLIESKIDNQ